MKALEDKDELADAATLNIQNSIAEIQNQLKELKKQNALAASSSPKSNSPASLISVIIPVTHKSEKKGYTHKGRAYLPVLEVIKEVELDPSLLQIIVVGDHAVVSPHVCSDRLLYPQKGNIPNFLIGKH